MKKAVVTDSNEGEKNVCALVIFLFQVFATCVRYVKYTRVRVVFLLRVKSRCAH